MSKRTLLLLLIAGIGTLVLNLLSAALTQAQTGPTRLIPHSDDGARWGFVDLTGEWAIEPQFDYAGDFAEGLAPVALEGKFGYVDAAGKVVIEPQFGFANPFSEGLALVNAAPDPIDIKQAYIDPTGKIVIDAARYESVSDFREGLALVVENRKFGFIDPTGQAVIKPQYTFATVFAQGLAAVEVNRQFGYINKTGQMVIKPQFAFAGPFSEGLAAARAESGTGFIDLTGKMVIKPTLAYAYDFSEGLAFADTGQATGFIDKTGKLVIEGDFNYIAPFSEGLAAVEVAGKFGYIDKTGQMVLEPQFNAAGPFEDGLAVVTTAGAMSLIDATGQARFTRPLPAPQSNIMQTDVIDFLPAVPAQSRSGSCWTGSIAAPVAGAYRCTVGNEISDPCLTADDGQTLVCGADPTTDEAGFQLNLTEPLPEPEPLPAAQTSGPKLTLKALQNAAYPSEWPAEGVAPLKDGEYTEKFDAASAAELVITLGDWVVYGDLDFDNDEDAAVVLVVNGGGSGTFLYLAPVLNNKGQPQPLAPHPLGDRANITALSIDRGQINISLITHGPNDPMCCPTLPLTLNFELVEDQLVSSTTAWLFQLADGGATCGLATGATGLVDGKRVNFFCSDGSAVIGGLQPGVVWQAEKVVFDETSTTPFAVKESKPVDILSVWRPVNPANLAADIGLTPAQVSFKPGKLGQSAQGFYRPASPWNPFSHEPAHLIFTISATPTLRSEPQPGRPYLRIYPAKNYRAVDRSAGSAEVGKQIDALTEMLVSQPTIITDDIPLLPTINAAQVLAVQVQYLDFAGGSGMRFLTHYAQDVSPVLNGMVFYTFQGLTADGRFYVTLYAPVSTPALPDKYEDTPAAQDYDAFAKTYDTYLEGVTAALNGQKPAQFTPDLTQLDALVESLQINAK